ncbi:MAG: outer membrane beta-barrel protein [Chitinispirillaceae bacterium]|nr:outer membrane beta-barrel protein [Chitinispirillaceae bacterium]
MVKRCVAGLFGAVVAVSFSFADVSPDISTGSKAVLFTFSGLDGLAAGEYNGGIGGKYYLTNPIALRGSLAFGMASQDPDGDAFGSSTSMRFGVSAGAEYHLSFERVSPFFGGEIGFSTTSTKVVDSNAGAKRTQINISDDLDNPGRSFNVGALGGVEFFITSEVSLSAEYQLGWRMPIGYEQKLITETTAGKVETTTKVSGISVFSISNSGALTLAVYF